MSAELEMQIFMAYFVMALEAAIVLMKYVCIALAVLAAASAAAWIWKRIKSKKRRGALDCVRNHHGRAGPD